LIVVELGIVLGTLVRLEFTSDTSSAVSFRTNFNQTDIPKGLRIDICKYVEEQAGISGWQIQGW
jgi:hypothetical protein